MTKTKLVDKSTRVNTLYSEHIQATPHKKMSANTKRNRPEKSVVKKEGIAQIQVRDENAGKFVKRIPQANFVKFERRPFRDLLNVLRNIREFNEPFERRDIRCSCIPVSTFDIITVQRRRRRIVPYEDTPEEVKSHAEQRVVILQARVAEIFAKDGGTLKTPAKGTVKCGSSKLPLRTPDSVRLKRAIDEVTQKMAERARLATAFGCTKIPVLTPEKLNCIYNDIKSSAQKENVRKNTNIHSNLVGKKKMLGRTGMIQQDAELSQNFQSTFKRRRMLLI